MSTRAKKRSPQTKQDMLRRPYDDEQGPQFNPKPNPHRYMNKKDLDRLSKRELILFVDTNRIEQPPGYANDREDWVRAIQKNNERVQKWNRKRDIHLAQLKKEQRDREMAFQTHLRSWVFPTTESCG